MTEKEIKQAITYRRMDLNMSKEELSLQTGLSRYTILNIEKGHTSPRLSVLLKIFDSLGLEIYVKPKEVK